VAHSISVQSIRIISSCMARYSSIPRYSRPYIGLMRYNTVLVRYKKRGVSSWGVKKRPLHTLTVISVLRAKLNKKTNTRTSCILDQAQSLPQVAGHAWCSSVSNAQKQASTRYRQRSHYTRRTPKSPHVLVRRSDRKTPTRLSRLAGGFHLDVDDVNYRPQHGILAGGLRIWGDRGCQAFDVGSCPVVWSRGGMTVGDSVKGGDYRRADRTALSARKG
jgi:hypothetical protein